MTEPQKSAAGITDSKKKSPEHDNEPDLLDSWRSSVRGNDVLDFSAEAVPRERKKVFDFGKLDDFELDAEFGNMPSFKMDMSDLDFSSPLKKTEKSKLGKDATPGKLEGKKDKFSFSFDFNELDAFDLDTNLLKGEKNPKNCSESDLLDCHENDVSKLPKLGGTNSSNSKHLVSSKGDLDTTNVSTSAPADVEQSNISQEDALTLREKQITSTQGEGKTNHSDGERDFHVEYPFTTGSEKANAQTCGQDFPMQNCDSSPKESIQQSQNAVPSLATVYVYSGEEKHSTSMISGDNSQSGIKSHAYDSKGLSAPYTGESISTVNTPEENQSDQKNIGQICVIMHQSDWKNVDQNSIVFHESPEMHKDVEDNSEGPLLNETLTSKSKEDKQRSSSKVLKSSLHSNSKSEQLIATKEENNGLKLLSLHKSLVNGSRASSATTLKQLFTDLHPTKEKREHSGDNEQKGNRTLKAGQNVVGGDSNHEDTNCSHGMQRPVSSTATVDTTQVASIENRGISLQRTDNRPNLSNMNISRIARSNKCLSNSFVKETKSVAILKESMVKHPKISPLAAHSVNKEETVHSQPLKRKLIEASHMDLVTSNSSKRILESPRERKSLQISPKTKEQVGAESEAVGGFDSDIYLDRWNSVVDEYVDGKAMSPGVPMTIENDGNVQKALACAKELENICNMLKKKHKEAKELLIRALVNSNSLLMLDHPIREEKILALQNFAAALLLKKYDV